MTEPSRRRSTRKKRPPSGEVQRVQGGQPDLPDRHASAEVAGHPIEASSIHPNVHFICRRLADHGHLALLVGGAVRDLLLGISPKDFDLATSARPEEVNGLFRNARIIGRRFRLVLVRYP
ncbi:MAG: poly(A) polymerase, partial [bacterium]